MKHELRNTLLCLLVLVAGAVGQGDFDSYTPDLKWEFHSADGIGNNVQYPLYGSAGSALLYTHPTVKPVPFKSLKNKKLQNPRIISNVVASAPHGQQRVTPRNVTDFLTVWAQFIDHDITRTPTGKAAWDIPVPKCDLVYDKECAGDKTIPFSRSARKNPYDEFSHPNEVTSFIDASHVYGSNLEVQTALRSFSGGRLRVSKTVKNTEGEWPPRVSEIPAEYKSAITMANDAKVVSTSSLFACGDVRCNEQPLLLALHVLFLREHNRVADILASTYSYMSDEELFQKARAYVIAEIQHITFNEYLFFLMGQRPFDLPYDGYKPEVNADIHVAFSTVGFRYGHSEVNTLIKRMFKGKYGNFYKTYYSQLSEHFFDNRLTFEDGICPIFVGMSHHAQGSMDNQASNEIRNDLFKGKKRHGADLIAIDIQRARDHGVYKYNDLREAYGLSRVESWEEFEALDEDDEVNEKELVALLKFLYATPDDCDAFICGSSEDWVETDITEEADDYSNLGPFFEAILHTQFAAIRDGDRFWYEDDTRYALLSSLTCLTPVKKRLLSSVIEDNLKGCEVNDYVFYDYDLEGLSRKRQEALGFESFVVESGDDELNGKGKDCYVNESVTFFPLGSP